MNSLATAQLGAIRESILKSRFIRSKRVNEAFHYVFFYRRLMSVQYLTSQVRFTKYNTECHNPQVGIIPRRFAVRPGRLTYLSKGTAISIFLNFFLGRSIYRTSISVTAGYITVKNSRTPDSYCVFRISSKFYCSNITHNSS